MRPDPDALTPEFLGWIAPVDRRDLASGESFGFNALQHQIDKNARCLKEQGYRALADVLTSKPVPTPPQSPSYGEAALLPNLQGERTGFLPPTDVDVQMEAVMFLQSINPTDSSNLDEVQARVSSLEQFYDDYYSQFGGAWGLSKASVADLSRVQADCMASIMAEPVIANPNRASVTMFQERWIQTMHEIDASEAVAPVMDNAVECLRSIHVNFADVGSIYEWHAVKGEMIASADASSAAELTNLIESWGPGFAKCLEPVEHVRRPLRLEARDRLVQEQFPVLLELQSVLKEDR